MVVWYACAHATDVELVVNKSARKIDLIEHGVMIKRYDISLGSTPVGHKIERGDGRTPEGEYEINCHYRKSEYHRALCISYPNDVDRRVAKEQGKRVGDNIMIHGRPNWSWMVPDIFFHGDWTDGCISVSNDDMDELWRRVPDGTKISILP